MSESDPIQESAAELARGLGRLQMRSVRDGNRHVIVLSGELDLVDASVVDAEIRRVESTDARIITVDLAQLQFIDSTGLAVLIAAYKRSRADSNRLTLVAPTGPAIKALEICGLLEVLPFEERPDNGA